MKFKRFDVLRCYLLLKKKVTTAEEVWKCVRAVNSKYRKSHLIKADVKTARKSIIENLQAESEIPIFHELVLHVSILSCTQYLYQGFVFVDTMDWLVL